MKKNSLNLPNILSLIRVAMVPAFMATLLFMQEVAIWGRIVPMLIFCLAAFTDFLDGYIARKYKLVTNLGKFLDPIADKVLVSTALIVMLLPLPTQSAIMPFYGAIAVAIILARELIVSGFRIVAASNGKVLAADKSGKIKTFMQDVAVIVLLFGADLMPGLYSIVNIVGLAILGLATLLTIYSGIECVVKNREVLKEEK